LGRSVGITPEGLLPYVYQQFAGSRMPAVLPEVDPLPGAETEVAVQDGDGERGGGEGRLDVRGHVVRPFGSVGVEGIALGDEAVEPGLQVAAGRRVGVLLDGQARR